MREEKVIIKKVYKNREEESHGGSWKVAYADFITAMMAFFLLLWLITMVSPEKRARVANYFKHFSVFEHSGVSYMEKSAEILDEAGETSMKVLSEVQGQFSMKPQDVKDVIRKAVEEKLSDAKDQVLVDVTDGGVRIQLVDKDGKPMFDLGSTKPTPLAVRILQVVSEQIKPLPNLLAIEGHTDSLPYNSTTYSNWELSTERALSARKQLEGNGVSVGRVSRVAGFADTSPLITENTKDPRNRRISIILVFPAHQKSGGQESLTAR
jgi:chemotaxis protein MotB